MITKDQVLEAQQRWAQALISIGEKADDLKQCTRHARQQIDLLYAWQQGEVLFKPTNAAEIPFRTDPASALSYFVGGNENFPEDQGFALQPWKEIQFENVGMCLNTHTALAMGHYYFTDYNQTTVEVEFSFGYVKDKSDLLKIQLHHSSLPYQR